MSLDSPLAREGVIEHCGRLCNVVARSGITTSMANLDARLTQIQKFQLQELRRRLDSWFLGVVEGSPERPAALVVEAKVGGYYSDTDERVIDVMAEERWQHGVALRPGWQKEVE